MKKHGNIAIFIPHLGCGHQCSFCNQNSISGAQTTPTPEKVESILQSAALQAEKQPGIQREVAFFGGSFTAIDRQYMCQLLQAVQPYLKNGYFRGIRISTRPDAIDENILELLARYGVTAIELGVQSLDEQVLTLNRRGHTAENARKSSCLIKQYGFSLGHQMMVGLYGDTEQKLFATAQEICNIHPDTIRIYPTLVLKHTYLYRLYKEGKYTPPDFDTAVAWCARLILLFTKEEINIIRVGLHEQPDLQQQAVAGVYHPAFKEICENKIYLDAILNALNAWPNASGQIVISVAKGCLSKALGQKKKNSKILVQKGFSPSFREREELELYQVLLSRD